MRGATVTTLTITLVDLRPGGDPYKVLEGKAAGDVLHEARQAAEAVLDEHCGEGLEYMSQQGSSHMEVEPEPTPDPLEKSDALQELMSALQLENQYGTLRKFSQEVSDAFEKVRGELR